MAFSVGDKIGPFTITEYIGQGGMATIFKARQATLDRDVALKVIHPALKQDESFVLRLKREAAIIAKLHHPNIVTVYDFTEFEGLPCLILQFIEGRTLKEVLRDQKLSTRQIVNIARAVASALSNAHERGVLHRDVKPSNILIDKEGHVYLSDFGLARIEHSGESTASQDMLIGSPQYLSPEQAKSEPVNVGSDVYAFGVVLYEMFTGRVPFHGETPYATILAHINNPPPAPRSINPRVRPAVEQVLLKALAKDPKQRYPSIRAMMKALENAVEGPRQEEPAAAIPLIDYAPETGAGLSGSLARVGGQIRSNRSPWLGIGLALGALALIFLCALGVGLVVFELSGSGTAIPRITAAISTSVPGANNVPTAIAFASPTAVPTRAPSPTPVPPTPTHTPVPPPPPPPPTSVPPSPTRESSAQPAPAQPRGKIAYSIALGEPAELHSVWLANADGTNPRQIIDLANWPAISPDGTQIAYHRIKDEGIYVAGIDGSNPRVVLKGETCCIQWSPDGKRLIYVLGKLRVGDTKIMITNLDGTGITEVAPGFNPAWSPDGNRIVYAGCQPNSNQCGLFVYDLKTKNATLITRDSGGAPQWSAKTDKIVYQTSAGGSVNVYVVNPDGSGGKQLTNNKGNTGQPTWSNDGQFIFYRSDQEGKEWAIFVMRSDGSNQRLLIPKVAPNATLWARESLSAGP